MENAGENHFVYSFPRFEGEEVKLTIREYQKKFYVDLRIWFRPENTSGGELQPTRKGLWVKIDQLRDLEKGIRELVQAASRFKPPVQQAWKSNSSAASSPPKIWIKN